MQKHTSPATYNSGSRNAPTNPLLAALGRDSPARAVWICCFCSSSSQRACSGRSVSQKRPITPSNTAGRPVRTNSTCQSRSPSQPCRCAMMVPDKGPQIMPATMPAMKNEAVMRPRIVAGNQ
ncbi:hypothetical protein D3C72_1687260 [compost metagenome]